MTPAFRRILSVSVAAALLLGLGILGHRSANAKKNEAEYYLPSTVENLYLGWFPRDAPPALTVPSGAVVKIDTISQRGVGGGAA